MTRASMLAGVAAAALLGHAALAPALAQDMKMVPPPAMDAPVSAAPQTIVLSGGCFWGVQGVFEHVHGVSRAVAGYAGGARDTAQYEAVSTGSTGHAESVRVTFDPRVISLGHVLQIFFSVALDPTELNRQGPDDGTQYRSEIWTSDAAQAGVAQAYIAQLNGAHVFSGKIQTRVDALPAFYPAEAYHQDFLENNPDYPYIAINDMPKVSALRSLFPADYTQKAVLAGVKS